MLDFPDPFGPTIAVIVGANSKAILLAKVLYPCNSRYLRRGGDWAIGVKDLSCLVAKYGLPGFGQGIGCRVLSSILLAVSPASAAQFFSDNYIDYKFTGVIRA